ncbi:hypothetical protein ACTWP5_18830 [Streptomyces sp. 4N509B]|uniref:hypothetical protein n=1 Tax=Streptomyces sp. 4N509B TaxID=3457413 RepID=UPI003FD42DA8
MTRDKSDLACLLQNIANIIPVEHMEWAEQEIQSAQERHGERGRGPIWNSWRLLRPNRPLVTPERLYRAHCREILQRVALGEDTRVATDAEKLATLSAASTASPLPEGAVCLYFRIYKRLFSKSWDEDVAASLDLEAYERIHGQSADDYDAWLNTKLYQKERT